MQNNNEMQVQTQTDEIGAMEEQLVGEGMDAGLTEGAPAEPQEEAQPQEASKAVPYRAEVERTTPNRELRRQISQDVKDGKVGLFNLRDMFALVERNIILRRQLDEFIYQINVAHAYIVCLLKMVKGMEKVTIKKEDMDTLKYQKRVASKLSEDGKAIILWLEDIEESGESKEESRNDQTHEERL